MASGFVCLTSADDGQLLYVRRAAVEGVEHLSRQATRVLLSSGRDITVRETAARVHVLVEGGSDQ